jgi:nicotinamidase-related amidase/type 1 glutamine amidotransferase
MLKRLFTLALAAIVMLPTAEPAAKKEKKVDSLRISMQQRMSVRDYFGTILHLPVPADLAASDNALITTQRVEKWDPAKTAIIICDMWDRHWCDDATARVAEIAPAMNAVLTTARARGVKIVHAPSDCIDYYRNHAARKEALRYGIDKKIAALADGSKLTTEADAEWPVDQSDEGCENSGLRPHRAWTKQIDAIDIVEGDLISDSGAEIGTYFAKKGIRNVILVGVHTNMCVIGRSFGLRAMKRMGMNVVLMRDMTDLMYNHERAPYVNHFSGLDLIVEYIETHVCPSIVSTDFTGAKQFRFAGDTRPRVAFLTAESEYRANQRLPEFAHELTLRNIHCDFAMGVPIMEGAGRHNLENLQILDDAALATVFIRRRALEPEKMEQIKAYVRSGRPLIGIRTASHAFDAKGNVPREGGSVVAAKEQTAGYKAQWAEFDRDVLGGNYQGHHGHLKTGTDVTIAPGMENHPLLKGVAAEFTSPNWLYKNRPLNSVRAQVLLVGHNPGVPDEPVAWLNGNVFYTSLGHWDDWTIPSFRNLLSNAVDYLLTLNCNKKTNKTD